ncbi:hypothetical protein ACHAW5_007469 [Stephanodiscus triporus]|uniref:Uncharacterized protein n=1 Tax=Stephanodiscus triporus TaxID=2934178 RepID=A0ABD3PDS5_9STRA
MEQNRAHSLGKEDEKTYRKWSELFVDAISYLECKVAFVSFLNDNEMAVADSGYRGKMHHIKTPDLMHFCLGEEYYDAAVARACHKTVNLRFKNKQVLVKLFRHSLAFYSSCFRAVAVNIEAGESLFSVQYIDEGKRRTICT